MDTTCSRSSPEYGIPDLQGERFPWRIVDRLRGRPFGYSGNIKVDLPGITSVHPMRKDALRDHMKKAGADWNVVANLIESGSLKEVEYQGRPF
jgi:hypothetical protein